MKIAYLIQYFGPSDNSFASGRSYDFAIEWAKSGHEVWVICSDAYLIDKNKPIHFHDLPIHVHVIKQNYQNEFGVLARIQAFFWFSLKALHLLLTNPNKYDVLYASSTPLSIGIVGWIQKWFTRKKWIFEARDLWPDFPIQVLGIKDSKLGKWLFKLEEKLYQNADEIICLSPECEQVLLKEKLVSSKKISMIPNGFSEYQEAEAEQSSVSYEYGFYEGALGKANGIHWLMDFVDEVLKLNSTIHFKIAGFGVMSKKIDTWLRVHEHQNRIHFLGLISRKETNRVLKAAQFSVTCFSDYAILTTNSPNKLFDAIGLTIPVVTNMNGWIGDLAIEYGGISESDPRLAAKEILIKMKNKLPDRPKLHFGRSKLAFHALSVIEKCG
ncbi:glycosyltransferase WbuB [bacterium]|nr:MAG: glycosyltransferase WbuB [bacterium]